MFLICLDKSYNYRIAQLDFLNLTQRVRHSGHTRVQEVTSGHIRVQEVTSGHIRVKEVANDDIKVQEEASDDFRHIVIIKS